MKFKEGDFICSPSSGQIFELDTYEPDYSVRYAEHPNGVFRVRTMGSNPNRYDRACFLMVINDQCRHATVEDVAKYILTKGSIDNRMLRRYIHKLIT